MVMIINYDNGFNSNMSRFSCNFDQAMAFYQSTVADFDMDLALESILFLSTHFIINTQLYCSIWNRPTLKKLSAFLAEETALSNL